MKRKIDFCETSRGTRLEEGRERGTKNLGGRVLKCPHGGSSEQIVGMGRSRTWEKKEGIDRQKKNRRKEIEAYWESKKKRL